MVSDGGLGFLSQVIGTSDLRIQSQISELEKTFMKDVAGYLYLCQSAGINNNIESSGALMGVLGWGLLEVQVRQTMNHSRLSPKSCCVGKLTSPLQTTNRGALSTKTRSSKHGEDAEIAQTTPKR